MAASIMVGTRKKNTTWHFSVPKSPGNQFPRYFMYDEYWIFRCELFSFYKSVLSPADQVGFFSKYLYTNSTALTPHDVFN